MPALQVRDFPQKLYEELKNYSALNHRSMAQQTIAAVDQMIHGYTEKSGTYTAAEKANESSRLKKRQDILQRAAQRKDNRCEHIPSPASVLSESHNERDKCFDDFENEFLNAKVSKQ